MMGPDRIQLDQPTERRPTMINAARSYTIMTNSTRTAGQLLARVLPGQAGAGNFWTESEPEKVWEMSPADAEEVIAKLHLNQPRIVRYEKAIGIIERQRDEMRAERLALQARLRASTETADDVWSGPGL